MGGLVHCLLVFDLKIGTSNPSNWAQNSYYVVLVIILAACRNDSMISSTATEKQTIHKSCMNLGIHPVPSFRWSICYNSQQVLLLQASHIPPFLNLHGNYSLSNPHSTLHMKQGSFLQHLFTEFVTLIFHTLDPLAWFITIISKEIIVTTGRTWINWCNCFAKSHDFEHPSRTILPLLHLLQ